jgi:hypothetical protein
MKKQLRLTRFVLTLGLILGFGYWQQQGQAAGKVGTELRQVGSKLKHLFSPARASKSLRPATATVPAAPMATITVTSLADGAANALNCPGANCRLRDAIAAAAAGDTIDFAVTGTITLTNGQLDISKNLTIQGPGATKLTISGNSASRMFSIERFVTVALNGLTLSNGNGQGLPQDAYGGAIYNHGNLILTNSTVSGNTASYSGGGIYNFDGSVTLTSSTVSGNSALDGGGIYNAGILTLTNSTVSGNTADSPFFNGFNGGGIFNRHTLIITGSTLSGNSARGSGGGIYNYIDLAGDRPAVTITNSTLSGNSTPYRVGGGICNLLGTVTLTNCTLSDNSIGHNGQGGGGIYNSSNLTLTNCTLSGNAASNGSGGGIYNAGTLTLTHSLIFGSLAIYGGGIYDEGTSRPTQLTLINSTLSSNQGALGGGLYHVGGNNATITNSTITGNRGTDGGGIRSGTPTLTLNFRNTLIAGNTATRFGPDVFGLLNSQGNNLIGNTADATIYGNTSGNLLNVNPLLAPLSNYGGATQTHALLPGSPAIDAGTNCVLSNNCASNNLGFNLTTDQRGTGFNRQVGSAVDIGAFESQGFTLALASGNNQSTATNTAFTNPLAVTVKANVVDEPVNNGLVTFTPPASGASCTVAGMPATITNGTATTGTVTANATAGSYNVAASAKGASAAVNFALTNTSSNAAPSITPGNLTRQQGSPLANVQIATVMDAEDAENNLTVTVNGSLSATTNGVTISNITVNAAGQVMADLTVTCAASDASFTLIVTDTASASANASLFVTVTANPAPSVGNYPNTTIAAGGSTIVTPAVAPADNGSIASITATATPNFFTGALTVNTVTGAVTITNANPVGGYTITVTLTDNCGATTTQSFMLTVNACGASLSKTAQHFAANGGTGNFTVTIDGACAWTAVSNNPSFITIVSPAGQQAGNGTVSFNVAGHSSTTPRSGTITVAGQTFLVRQGAQFSDVPVGAAFYEEIGKLSAVGVTQGCGGGNYCPGSNVTREQMAAFIIRALGDFNPPPPATQRFGDVPSSNPFYGFIEQMAVRQITLGCGGGNYCPTANVTREQIAAFIIRALHEPGYVPPAPGSQRFADVPSSNPFYAHIEEMAVRAITLGCGGGNYCPTANVTRGQMAAFLVRAFGL